MYLYIYIRLFTVYMWTNRCSVSHTLFGFNLPPVISLQLINQIFEPCGSGFRRRCPKGPSVVDVLLKQGPHENGCNMVTYSWWFRNPVDINDNTQKSSAGTCIYSVKYSNVGTQIIHWVSWMYIHMYALEVLDQRKTTVDVNGLPGYPCRTSCLDVPGSS